MLQLFAASFCIIVSAIVLCYAQTKDSGLSRKLSLLIEVSGFSLGPADEETGRWPIADVRVYIFPEDKKVETRLLSEIAAAAITSGVTNKEGTLELFLAPGKYAACADTDTNIYGRTSDCREIEMRTDVKTKLRISRGPRTGLTMAVIYK
jgi:hypothetical protein